MAADSSATILKIRAEIEGLPGLNQLKTAIRGIDREAKNAKNDLNFVNSKIKELSAVTNKSVNNLRMQKQAFEAVRNSARIGSLEYRNATTRIRELNRELEKTQIKGRTGGGLASLGAVASAGFFGGPEALAGAGIGAFFGPQGAFAGAAIGAQVAQLRKAAMGAAEYSQTISRLNIALESVVKNSDDFAKAQQVINNVSTQLNVPILEATQNFTRLTAAVVGAGGNVSDSEIVFRGITSAIKATGGSAEDVQGALVAMSQVFSKGKVSAEELQGQLGERLPGAVTLFAEATGRTLPQLAKDLEQGTIGLNDLMQFATELSQRYSSSAEQMAKSSEDSAARMKVALDGLGKAFGDFFKPVKEGIDETITGLANMVTRFLQAAQLMQMGLKIEENERADIRATARQIAGLRAPGLGRRLERAGIEEQLYQEGILNKLRSKAYEASILDPAITAPTATTVFGAPKAEKTGGTQGKGKKDISDALRDAQLAAIGLYQEIEPLQQIALDREAKILQIKEQQLKPNKEIVAIAQVNKDTEKQVQALVNGTAKSILDKTMLLREQSVEREKTIKNLEIEAGIIDEKDAREIRRKQFIADLTRDNGQLTEAQLARINAAFDQINAKSAESAQLMRSIGQTLQTGVADAFMSIIDSAKSLRDVLSDVLRQTARLLLDYGIKAGLSAIPGLGGLFANGGVMTGKGPMPLKRYASGGVANSPQLAMFGEGSTPEAYVPLPDGRSIPVTMRGGGGDTNIVVNVEAGGTTTRGGDASGSSRALGSAIAAAVQAELIKQQRPGGLLA
jgi:tape measure domain-containing protein